MQPSWWTMPVAASTPRSVSPSTTGNSATWTGRMPSSPTSGATGRLTLGTGSTRWRRRGQGHRAAVDTCHRTPGLEAWSALAHAEMAAGHSIAGERTAQALTRAYPGCPRAWTTLARVLHEHGRHRDAIEPAREAVRLTEGAPTDLALLACILARTGVAGREESLKLAERAIVEMVRSATGSVVVLASMADIVSRYADRDEPSLRHGTRPTISSGRRGTRRGCRQSGSVPPPRAGVSPRGLQMRCSGSSGSQRHPRASLRPLRGGSSSGWTLLDACFSTLAPHPEKRRWHRCPVLPPSAASLCQRFSTRRSRSVTALTRLRPRLGSVRSIWSLSAASRPMILSPCSISVRTRTSGRNTYPYLSEDSDRGSSSCSGPVRPLSARSTRSTRPKMKSPQSSVCSNQNRSSGSAGRPEQPEVRALQDEGSVLDPATRARLVRVMELATLDDESLRRVVWQATWEETVQ